MTEPNKDKELESNTKGKGKEVITVSDHEDTSGSTTSSDGSKVCIDAMDYFTKRAQDIAIREAVAGKRRKRAQGGIKRSISLKSELSKIGMSIDDDSDSEPTNAKGKGQVQEEITDDVFKGSDTDSDEACKRMKKGRNNNNDDNDDDDDDDGGAGSGAGTHTGFSSMQGVQVAGK